MVTRSTVVTAALAAAAALAATGITYASAASTEPAQAAPVVQQQAAAPVSALNGGESGNGNEGNEGKGNEGKGGGYEGKGGGYENKGGGENKGRRHFEGRVHINERTFSARETGCITVVSGLGSKTLNIRNDSRRTVEVFRGATCDNGAPLATVGPWSSSDGVHPGRVKGGVKVHNGVVGSFRVIERHHGGGGYGGGGDFGDDY
ncbi:hypothetical protein [Streptomyces atratus]|uniref:Uncharacterized protein n=1 Tax=Streptomyces atratus TaxID=1893 RepID=A0A2Z5JLB1_STRAR|nr:hypothetical protein [Streptomyces atratus]AXE81246.1 hypothetical protein C5746_34675 [Streptomyces atratus]